MKTFSTLLKTPYEKMIVACLVAREAADLPLIASLYAQCNDRKLLTFAKEHEAASIVAMRLETLGKATANWSSIASEWKYRLLQRFEKLDRLAQACKEAGIPMIALKNAGIARAIYPHPEECPMGDFDTLVKKSDFVQAHHIALAQGFVPGFRAVETIEEEGLEAGLISGGLEYRVDLADDTLWLELQWRSIAGRWIAPEIEPKTETLFETALPVEGSSILILDPVWNLIQVCLHTAKHSYIRAPGLRLHTDVDRIVRAYPDLDWQTFVQRIEQMRLKTATYFSLAIPAELMNTPIPEWVLSALRPPKRQYDFIFRAIEKGGLFHPMQSKFSRPAYLAFAAMLFDSPLACWRTAFPSPRYMREHYGLTSGLTLPWHYAKRFANLLFRRVKT
ncbi:MAG: nucleotidyltransferase family protein [Proteobacteria bacterium]|nr:nucleotidyltransferase family protein [Pseudomonadota bacterium]